MADNQMETAVENLETVAHCLEEGEEPKSLYLPNCTQDKLISLEEVKRQQESLQRCQSLEETQRLFDAGKYQQVVDYLTPTFAQSQAVQSGLKRTLPDPERHAQLELLQDALFRLEDWGQCLLWGEEALNESLHHYRRAPTIPARDNWALTLVRLFQSLQKVLDKDPKAVGSLPLQSSIRLVQNLMRIIEMNHDVSDAVTEMPISSVLPWILLYRIIRHEEEKLHALKLPDPENRDDMKGVISSSLMLLGVAHEYLGRHAWCTRDSGIFLLFYMDVLAAELSKAAESVKEDLETAFEQCVLCLYKHPNKKGKARHLYDHNATPIDLTWAKCEVVFEYFKPKTVPEFDSYKTSTVSGELENLLHRIYTLIPDDLGPGKRVDQVREYIEGNTNVSPSFSTDSPILQELYYLMADYFFKNKEPAKAIKYYTYDVCFNSWRLDSWAGLALAKNCQIEQKLNSMELKIDAPFHRKSIAALRCFSRAVEIDESVRKLWIEYGALAYQLHSHASRQLRMQLWFPLTSELLEIAMETRVEMLATARNCYWKASECEAEGSEEEWLHHYMMGKVMEKKRAHPRHYLEHFKQAAIYLHEEEAKYPRKILYQHSPPHLSLEALEMYYRLHVAVLKYLLRVKDPETKNDMALFDRYVTEATESPFAQRKEKHVEMRESVSSADDVDSQLSAASIPPYSTAHQKPVYHMTPQDHNYSKQKSSGGETSDASCGLKDTLTETEGSQSGEEVDTLTASEIQSQDSADDNDQSSVIAAPGNRQSAAKRDESAMESDLGDSVAMETSSQDDSVVSSHPPREGSGPASETQSDKAREKVEAVAANKQEEMATEVVELHAETDSQVTGDFVDTKPLLLDKKVSGGFEPHFDPAFELGDSESQKSGKDSSCNRTSLLRKEQEMGTGTSQNPPTKPSLTEEVAGSEKNEKLEPVSAAVDQQDKSAQVASSQVKNPRSSPSDLVTSGAVQEAEQREAVTASCLESGELSQEEDIVDAAPPTGVQNDSRRVITALSLESGELSQEEDVISVHTTSCSVISISDEEDTPSRTSSHKRPLQQDSPSNKRARVELDGEQTGGDGEGKEIVQEILSQEDDASKAADVTKPKDHPMEVDEVICISPENRDVAEDGRDTVVTPETSTLSVTDAHVSGTKGHAGSGQKEDRAGDGENKEETSPVAGVHRNVGGPSVGTGTTESSPLGGKVARCDPPSGGDKNILMPLASAQEAKGSIDSNLMKTADGVKQEPKSEQPTETDSIVILDDEDKPASLDSKEGSPLTKDKERAVVSDDQEKPVLSGDADQLVDSEKAATPESGKVVLSGDTEQADAVQKRKENEPTVKEEEFSDASVARSGGSEPAEKTTASGSMGTEPAADQKQNGVVSNQKGQTSDQRENGASGSQSESKASTSAQPSSGSDKPDTPLSEGDFKEWKVRLLEKCIAGLHVCLSRFPTHYKSIYRLAHLYYMSETHRNLEFARDLLLGNPEWQKLSHMPANGLFAERRANNLFQGTWKIPIEEIDRAGSFASHINRSVHLLLDVLRDLGDVRMLLSLHTQLRKKPDQGRKYLRDGERQVLARMAHSYALDAVARQLERPETEVDKTEVLVSAYRAYNAHRSGSDARRAMMLLVTAYQWLGLPQHGFGSSVEQAVQYCTALITSQAQAMVSDTKSRQESTSPDLLFHLDDSHRDDLYWCWDDGSHSPIPSFGKKEPRLPKQSASGTSLETPSSDSVDGDASNMSDSLPVPQVKIGPDGNIILNIDSLVVENKAGDSMEENVVEEDEDRFFTCSSFRENKKGKFWTKNEERENFDRSTFELAKVEDEAEARRRKNKMEKLKRKKKQAQGVESEEEEKEEEEEEDLAVLEEMEEEERKENSRRSKRTSSRVLDGSDEDFPGYETKRKRREPASMRAREVVDILVNMSRGKVPSKDGSGDDNDEDSVKTTVASPRQTVNQRLLAEAGARGLTIPPNVLATIEQLQTQSNNSVDVVLVMTTTPKLHL
nr:hypothetical protein BaRGS_034550 [Batillaria attramentaria]